MFFGLSKQKPIDYSNASSPGIDRSTVICKFTNQDNLLLEQAFEGISIFGGTGSGKTSGSGKNIAKPLLRLGMGGLVLTAKADERQLWEKYAQETGRSDDLIFVDTSPDSKTLNLLSYEYQKNKNEGSIVHEMANMLNSAIDSMQTKSGNGGDEFWIYAAFQTIVSALDVLTYAYDDVDILKIVNFIRTSPSTLEEANKYKKRWKSPMNFFEETITKAFTKLKQEKNLNKKQSEREDDFWEAEKYWMKEFPAFPPKTRSSVICILMARLSGLLHSPYRRLFSSETTVRPEDTFGENESSKIIIVDLPIKKYGDSGRFAQILFKSIWQRAVERRNVKAGKPVFLWADEAQFFVTKTDLQFQQTARSSQAVTVYLSQSIANYHAALGESSSNSSVTDALMGNFQTMIFHSNGCHVTNKYAEEVFGYSIQTKYDSSNQSVYNATGTTSLSPEVSALEFTRLKKGGVKNSLIVEGYVFQSGRVWESNPDRSWVKASFRQDV